MKNKLIILLTFACSSIIAQETQMVQFEDGTTASIAQDRADVLKQSKVIKRLMEYQDPTVLKLPINANEYQVFTELFDEIEPKLKSAAPQGIEEIAMYIANNEKLKTTYDWSVVADLLDLKDYFAITTKSLSLKLKDPKELEKFLKNYSEKLPLGIEKALMPAVPYKEWFALAPPTYHEIDQRALKVAFSPDSKLLAIGLMDDNAYLLDITTDALPRVLLPVDNVHSMAFSLDGKYLATGSMDKVHIWNVITGEEHQH